MELAGPSAGGAESEAGLHAVLERIGVRLGLQAPASATASAAALGDLALLAARGGRRLSVLDGWTEAE